MHLVFVALVVHCTNTIFVCFYANYDFNRPHIPLLQATAKDILVFVLSCSIVSNETLVRGTALRRPRRALQRPDSLSGMHIAVALQR